MTRKVAIIQQFLPHYRIRFFELVRTRLEELGVSLILIHGLNHDKRFLGNGLDWADEVQIWEVGPLLWHRETVSRCIGCDLVVVAQETKYLVSHLMQLARCMGGPKFAFWGHGKNFQALNANSIPERIKRFLAVRADWWFAYNQLSSRVVEGLGFPKERITSVGNAIDTGTLVRTRDGLNAEDLQALRNILGIQSDNVAVYTGGIYPEKRIPFLLQAARRVRATIEDFELLVIGDGPERWMVSSAAQSDPWIHDLGPMNDQDKVPYWAISKMLLMPGLVGLVVVDSFALGVPIVTTDYPYHSPEIDYLESGRNGLLVECGDDVESYADSIIQLFRDRDALNRLRDGALESANQHSIERMVENFVAGVMSALSHSKS